MVWRIEHGIYVFSLPVPFYAFQLYPSVFCAHNHHSCQGHLTSDHDCLISPHCHICKSHSNSASLIKYTANIYWEFSECQALSWALEKSTQSILKIIQGNKEWLHFWCLMTIRFQAPAFLPTSAPYLGKLWYERSGFEKKGERKTDQILLLNWLMSKDPHLREGRICI